MKTTTTPTHEVRANRGTGNGGSAYLNSPFWDNIKKNKVPDGNCALLAEQEFKVPDLSDAPKMTEEEHLKRARDLIKFIY